MPFYCLRCGECCSAMGDVHAIEGDLRTGFCVVVNRYTGERTSVSVDPDKITFLDSPTIPDACPLFRRDADGLGICTVHDTWPEVCADYKCWRVLVVDGAGRRVARVMGTRHIAVDEPGLDIVLAPYRERMAGIVDDASWEAVLADILERAGYRIIR